MDPNGSIGPNELPDPANSESGEPAKSARGDPVLKWILIGIGCYWAAILLLFSMAVLGFVCARSWY